MLPRSQKPDGATNHSSRVENMRLPTRESTKSFPVLHPNQPQANFPLGQGDQNRARTRSSPKKSNEGYYEGGKTTSAQNTARLLPEKEKRSGTQMDEEGVKTDQKPKKSKSSTSLSTFLARPKSSRNLNLDGQQQQKDKENRTPPKSSNGDPPPPIWAQFATSPQKLTCGSTYKVPLNDRQDMQDEADLYTPQNYSPSKGRNFYDEQPTLLKRAEPKPRPRSTYLPSSVSASSFAETISGLRKSSRKQNKNAIASSQEQDGDVFSSRTSNADARKVSDDSSQSGLTMPKSGSRVMAAVAIFNGKMKESATDSKPESLDPKAVDYAFEALLESRNIEQNVREKMRTLDTNIKADFINKNNKELTSSGEGTAFHSADASRPTTAKSNASQIKTFTNVEGEDKAQSPKKSRPRSLTFTLSKGDQSPKKAKGERLNLHGRTKSASLVPSASASSLHSSSMSQISGLLSGTPRQSAPEDFIAYLRKVRRPQLVEVGRLQKLRQLLRNETVAWVDSFIVQGGLAETVGLLYRIIDIEWREEHEDTLLHHTLMCLKALFATTLALRYLDDIQRTLFPILLRLLFSSGEEKKGPSEFATRSIIIALLFTYVSTSPSKDASSRARTILSYLRDPIPKDDERPPGFIDQMRRPRPYKVWCKEITDVTKEVFWIFLHHLNVIPYPPPSAPSTSYAVAHFPVARAPVAAAPYVGGVEWEATMYLATHLDLLNALIALLPTIDERNSLRMELRDSGFEKVMGSMLRTCKEKFYGGVHAGLGTWVGAALEDGWACNEVREGPKKGEVKAKIMGSPKKKGVAPKLEMPKLEAGKLELGGRGLMDDGWL
ncbi:hypothetical protein MMC13_005258 [Lambiella insularis]|nr:hypothetical protein [Lambiella insularis]